MDRPQVLEVVLLGQDEDHCVVAIAATGVDLKKNPAKIIFESGGESEYEHSLCNANSDRERESQFRPWRCLLLFR